MSEGTVPPPPERGRRASPRPRPPGQLPPVAPPSVAPPPVVPPPPSAPNYAAPRGAALEYSSSVVAPAQIGLGVLIGLVLALVLVEIRSSLWPFAIIAFLVVAGAGAYVASVSVDTTRTYLEIGQGRGDREPRRIGFGDIERAFATDLTWAQCFGLGMPRGTPTTRLSVRPGPTLVLELRDGELVRVSTPDPQAVLSAIGAPS